MPNPVKNAGILRLSTPEPTDVAITIYSIDGRIPQKLLKGKFAAGIHLIPIKTTNLSTGIYFIEIKTNDQVKKNKIIILKY